MHVYHQNTLSMNLNYIYFQVEKFQRQEVGKIKNVNQLGIQDFSKQQYFHAKIILLRFNFAK